MLALSKLVFMKLQVSHVCNKLASCKMAYSKLIFWNESSCVNVAPVKSAPLRLTNWKSPHLKVAPRRTALFKSSLVHPLSHVPYTLIPVKSVPSGQATYPALSLHAAGNPAGTAACATESPPKKAISLFILYKKYVTYSLFLTCSYTVKLMALTTMARAAAMGNPFQKCL